MLLQKLITEHLRLNSENELNTCVFEKHMLPTNILIVKCDYHKSMTIGQRDTHMDGHTDRHRTKLPSLLNAGNMIMRSVLSGLMPLPSTQLVCKNFEEYYLLKKIVVNNLFAKTL